MADDPHGDGRAGERARRREARETIGAYHEQQLRALLERVRDGFARLDDVFEKVAVNHESGTVEWPGEVDLDPEVLYGRYEPVSGHQIKRRTLRRPATAAH